MSAFFTGCKDDCQKAFKPYFVFQKVNVDNLGKKNFSTFYDSTNVYCSLLSVKKPGTEKIDIDLGHATIGLRT